MERAFLKLPEESDDLSPLANLAGDIQVAPQTAKAWLEALERMYVLFRVLPYSQNIARALIKPPKVYFFDNADVAEEQGTRFENLVAATLDKPYERDGIRITNPFRYFADNALLGG